MVYKHISPSDKIYIGITSMNPKDRWANGNGYKGNKHFSRAINKYGWDNFEHIIIVKGLSKDEAEWLEKQLIKVYDSTNPNKGYNKLEGGDASNGLRGELNPMYGKGYLVSKEKHWNWGKHTSEKTKQKISKNHPNTKRVICITTKRLFNNMKNGADFYNTKKSNISSCCKGKLKSAGKLSDGTKLVWKYLNINHNKILRGADINKLHTIEEARTIE